MQKAFNHKIAELNEALHTEIALTLRFIVHFGKFTTSTIKGLKKLQGQAILETQQLLKNVQAQHASYTLFSNSFVEAIEDRQYNLSEIKTTIPEIGIFYYQDL